MTSVDHATRSLPGSPEWADLLAQVASGAKDQDLDDENPFDQVAWLKRAGFGALRLPEHLGGAGFSVPLPSVTLTAAGDVRVRGVENLDHRTVLSGAVSWMTGGEANRSSALQPR
jgi:alkylation response protein AidB-like acyl-CoA dehydrogenase